MIGVGAQLTLASFIALVEFCIFSSMPGARGVVFYVSIVVLACCGFMNGFISSRVMKFF